MSIHYIKKTREKYETTLLKKFGEPKGSSVDQISHHEFLLGQSFPAAYKEYLLWMGNDHQGIFRGSEWYLRDLIDNNEFLEEMLGEQGFSLVPEKQPVCFFSHQGYMAAWFYLPSSYEDPLCYFFSESIEPLVIKEDIKFSDFLFNDMVSIIESVNN